MDHGDSRPSHGSRHAPAEGQKRGKIKGHYQRVAGPEFGPIAVFELLFRRNDETRRRKQNDPRQHRNRHGGQLVMVRGDGWGPMAKGGRWTGVQGLQDQGWKE